MQLLTELNDKISTVAFEVDFGFSFNDEFTSNYKKRFHNTGYTMYSITFFMKDSEIALFDTFYNETLHNGVEPVEMDIMLGDGLVTYHITDNPEYNQIEANLYSVDLRVLKKKTPSTIECRSMASTFNSMFNSMSGINTDVTNYVSATEDKKKLTLAIYNLFELVSLSIGDINTYKEKFILTNSEVI